MRRVAWLLVLGSCSLLGQRLIDTVAGGAIQSGVPASSVSFNGLGGIAGDAAGNLYVTESGSNLVRRIRPDGIIETLAGTGVTIFSGDGGPATAASLHAPSRILLDGSGNLLVIDYGNYRIRRIDPAGTITTVAGTGIQGPLGTGGPAVAAQIDVVADIALGRDGTLYFSEPALNQIRGVTPSGLVVLVAGAPQPRSSFPGGDTMPPPLSDGDGGPAVAAHLAIPTALAADRLGNLYLADTNHAIRRIGPDGIITTIAGAGKPLVSALGTGDGGPAQDAGFESIQALAADAQGALYISEAPNQWDRDPYPSTRIRKIAPDGTIATVAGGPGNISVGDGPALGVRISATGLFADSKGNIYFSDYDELRRVTPALNIETVAGGAPEAAPDGPDARKVWLLTPLALAVDPAGSLYVAETECRIRKVTPAGAISTVAGTGNCVKTPQAGPVATTDLPYLYDLAVTSQGVVYASDEFGHLLSIQPGKAISIVQGFYSPPLLRLAVDSQDRVYVLYMYSQYVWRISPGAAPEIFVGPGHGPSLAAPIAIAVGPSDDIYISDPGRGNGFAYRIQQTGTVSVLQIGNNPDSIAVDAAGNVKAINAGSLTGFGSFELWGFGGDGGPLQSARLGSPSRLVYARTGDFYFLDVDNRRVRKITGSPPSRTPSISAAGIVNAASLVSSALAPGELISIFGTNLGPSVPWITAIDNNSVPVVAGHVLVLFDNMAAPLTIATANQINAFVPYEFAAWDTVDVRVENDGVSSGWVTLKVAKTAFGLFSADSSGAGQGAILNQDNSLNGAAQPAARGSVITLYGTGEGLTTPALPDGALVLSTPFSVPAGPVTVTIGGQPAEVLYAGAAPTLPTGVLQIDARVPANIAPGNAAVAVSIGGTATVRTITVAVK